LFFHFTLFLFLILLLTISDFIKVLDKLHRKRLEPNFTTTKLDKLFNHITIIIIFINIIIIIIVTTNIIIIIIIIIITNII